MLETKVKQLFILLWSADITMTLPWTHCDINVTAILTPPWPPNHIIVRWEALSMAPSCKGWTIPITHCNLPSNHVLCLASCVTGCSLIQAHILHFLPLVTVGTASSDLWPPPHLVYELTASSSLWSCSVACEHTLAFRPGSPSARCPADMCLCTLHGSVRRWKLKYFCWYFTGSILTLVWLRSLFLIFMCFP